MRISPWFVVAATVCVVPFGLAIRQDLQRNEQREGLARHLEKSRAYDDETEVEPDDLYANEIYSRDDDDEGDELGALYDRQIEPSDLDDLVGTEPATMGPLLEGIALGAASTTFLSDSVRSRIEAYKLDHELTVDFDFDEVSLYGITIRMSGDEGSLRDAMISRWGTPRRLDEDTLVWLGANAQRAVYSAMSDGADLRLEQFSTVDAIIAPKDKARLGVEPFSLLGASVKKLEQAIGARLQESSYDSERYWALPGIGNGSGKTMVKVTLDGDDRVDSLVIEGATDETDSVRDALVAKWGMPTDDDGVLTWTRGRSTYTVELWDHGFALTATRR
jgi:hypothetical protein